MSSADKNSNNGVEGAGVECILSVINEWKTETSQQLVKVGRRLNFLEKKFANSSSVNGGNGSEEVRSSTEVSDDGECTSTDAYGFGNIDLSRKKES